jgi:hypothetical protein
MYFVAISLWSSLNAIRLYMSDFVLKYFVACLESSNSQMKEVIMNILFRQIHSNWKTDSFIHSFSVFLLCNEFKRVQSTLPQILNRRR